MYDTGLRVSELVALDTDMLDFDDGVLRIPSEIQKNYPNGQPPDNATLTLNAETQRLLRGYLNNRWKDTPALFPSRSSNRIGERAVQNLVKKLAKKAQVEPYVEGGGRGDPGDLHPHALRHSVPYRMLTREGETLNKVKRRLRHSTILTTERIYEHFEVR
jgi:integrase/recombinase XerC/integrase/recombinase XerD